MKHNSLLNHLDLVNCKHGYYTLLFFLLSTLFSNVIIGQTTLIDPLGDGGFETGDTFATNGWSNNSSQTNQWVCSTGATSGFSGTNAAYISNSPSLAIPPNVYANNSSSVSHIYRDISIPAGETFIQLNFDWISRGESGFDYMRVWLVPVSYIPNSGTQISTTNSGGTSIGQNNYGGQSTWNNESVTLPSTYAGTTFRLVFEWRNDSSIGTNPPAGIDNISLTSTAPIPPANDNCDSPISLIVNTDNSCSLATQGQLTFATASGIGDCTTGVPNDDVWFSFVATSTTHTISLLDVTGTYTDLVHAVYSNACGSLNMVSGSCSNPNDSMVTGLSVGQTYFIQVYSWADSSTLSQQPTIVDFDICVGAPPSNDDPCNAIALDVSGDCMSAYGNTLFATDSNISSANCNTSGDDDDIWFSFVAQETSHSINIENVSGNTTNLFHAVYEGSCGSPASMPLCSFPNNSTATGLIPGATYYVQVMTSSVGNYNASFEICTIPLVSPCSNPSTLPELSCSTNETAFITGGTGFFDNNPCGSWDLEGQEALYTFTPSVTAEYSISQISTSGSGSDAHINYLYKEANDGCNANNWNCIAHLEGNDQGSSTFTLTGGVTYYILLDTETTSSNNVTFQISCPPQCGDSFYDSGGISANYSNNESRSITICPETEGSDVTVTFTSFQVEGAGANYCFDNLRVYDGPDDTFPQITPASLGLGPGTDGFCYQSPTDGTANLVGQSITATNANGCLTFVFTSDGTTTLSGWEAEVSCCTVWNGSVNTDWNVAENWSPSEVPTLEDCIVIPDNITTPNDPILVYAENTIAPQPGYGLSLTLKDNAYLELDSSELIIDKWIDVQGSAVFNIKNNASLMQIDDNNLNTGNIYVQRAPNSNFSSVNGLEYVYWSSPVNDFNVGDVSPGTGSGLIFEWNPTVSGYGVGNHGYWENASGIMTKGKGYAIRGLSGTSETVPNNLTPATEITVTPHTVLFSGEANNGVIEMPIQQGGYNEVGDPGYQGNSSLGTLAYNDDDNWNLIGNPYPSAISSDAFVAYNTDINGTVYLWQHEALPSADVGDPFYEDYVYNYSADNYIEYNSSGSNPPGYDDLHIASGQGFFVLMNHSTTVLNSTVTFNNSMRTYSSEYNNSTFFRQNNTNSNTQDTDSADETMLIERHRIWLNLSNSNNIANTLLLGYIQGATNNFDRLYDGFEVTSTDLSFYTINSDDNLSIQGRSLPFNQDDTIPLGMYLPADDIFSIAINSLDGLFVDEGKGIYLEDTYLNTIHDLKQSPYSFSGNLGLVNDRFILRFTGNTLTNAEFNLGTIMISAPEGEYIKISSGKDVVSSVTVYDILGRVIITRTDINKQQLTLNKTNKTSGVYFVKAVLANGIEKTQKVILK
ncbi:T9SS sorting signal type C domain-containing protein [Mangrovimonas sp. YM274]|uniref:T9SS sorting signal type C domain-containing protein n=1 Tax=Mangrovimonas sp. YM274 TaxID=3070660 RepID=UPI0027DDCD63|nr:T9SS sorting signal type C domain-containing protein [Mangrovimonas sp. YM274]WMI69915.1 T9SS sorting signal type C domain-containing protein [Mangrovimonas sp. YM274]